MVALRGGRVNVRSRTPSERRGQARPEAVEYLARPTPPRVGTEGEPDST
jgi:hypothetical protein